MALSYNTTEWNIGWHSVCNNVYNSAVSTKVRLSINIRIITHVIGDRGSNKA